MAIVTVSEVLNLIKPHYNNKTLLVSSLTELNKLEVQLETITDVYMFKNGCIIVELEPTGEPRFTITDGRLDDPTDVIKKANIYIDLSNTELDVFAHE